MRLSSICSVIIVLGLVGLAPSFAAAQNAHMKGHYRYHHHYHHHKMSPVYNTCTCHFGYGDSCAVAVACATEGGQCSGSCVLPLESK